MRSMLVQHRLQPCILFFFISAGLLGGCQTSVRSAPSTRQHK